jgi:L-amino acid N-acyltransferase YncA
MALLIRLAGAEDAAEIAVIYRPYVEDSRISFEEQAPDVTEMRRRIAGDRPGYFPWLVAEDAGRMLGYAASSPFRSRPAYRWIVETGIYLGADAQGRGVGRALLSSLIELLQRQGYAATIGAIALPNAASVALHERLGFYHTGTYRQVGFKGGEWLDVGLWQKDLADRAAAPAEPLPASAVGGPG